MGDDAVQRTLQLAHVRRDAMGQELHHLARDRGAQLLGLRIQDAQAQLIGRGVDVGDQAPTQTRAQPLFHPLQIRRRFVGRDDHLVILIHQGVEGMKEFFLGRFFAADELDIVDHQHVDAAELLLERHRVLETQRTNELIHELFGGKVDHAPIRLAHPEMPRDRVHEVRLAQTHAAIEEQRVEGDLIGLGHPAGRCVRELVRLADDEILEREARVERRAEGVAVIGGHRRRRVLDFSGGFGCSDALGKRPVLGRARGIDHDLDAPHLGVHLIPDRGDAIGVILGDPVADKARGHRNADATAIDILESQRLEPASVGGFAEFRAQAAAHARPLSPDFRIVAAVGGAHSCTQGRAAAFQPSTAPRWRWPSCGPSKPPATLWQRA